MKDGYNVVKCSAAQYVVSLQICSVLSHDTFAGVCFGATMGTLLQESLSHCMISIVLEMGQNTLGKLRKSFENSLLKVCGNPVSK